MSGLGGSGGGDSEIYPSRGSGSGHQRSRNEAPNQRYSNLIYDSEVFLTKLREFKPQSLGCLEARRKSSSTLIFPNPQQACLGPPKCTRYPHGIKPTPGYWIECHGSGPQNRSSAIDSSHKPPSTGPTGTTTITAATAITTGTTTGTAQANADIESESEFNVGQSALTRLSSSGSQTLFVRPSTSSSTSSKLIDDPSSSTKIINTPNKRKSDVGGHQLAGDSDDHSSSSTIAVAIDTQQQQDQLNEKATSKNDKSMIKQDSLSLTRDHLAESSPNIMPNADSTVDTKDSKRASEMRKRLNKRTMTRDDIDLHKPRRGTPNITITEPSFNQSTITYLSRHHPRPIRQGSQGGGGGGGAYTTEIRRHESVDSSTGAGGVESHHSGDGARSSATTPFSNRAVSALSSSAIDSPLSMDDLTSTSTATGDIQSTTGITRNQGSFERDQTTVDNLAIQYRSISKQQQHRPSIIREDSGPDEEIRTISGGAESSIATIDDYDNDDDKAIGDGKLTNMGLSTQTFQKKSYQEQQHQYQQQQIQLQQQQQLQLQQQQQEQEEEERQQEQQTNTSSNNRFRDGSLELISFEEENYEKHYYGREHWNYFTNDELLGPVMLSLKQEVNNQRDHFHVLLRTVSYTLHGTIPASTICADRYDREAIVRELSEIAKLKPPLMLGQLPSTPDELLKLDHIFIKTELKVGVIYIKAGQAESEESILGNKEESPLFTEFLDLLGDRITLKGFDRYKGGLDTVHNLTGTESVYTMWRNIEIMFHVSTMLPHEENDPQKLQKKRHIGNDIVCVAFIEDDDTLFWPGCIKSYFLHTFITIRTSARPLKEGEKRKYTVSCVCRNEVQYAFKPYLVEQDEFYKSDFFREWLLVKIVNGERASYSAPKFARMQDRTRSQLLEDIITNLANHLVTGQIPKPYRRGSWRPLGHTRASSPLEDSMKDYFEDYDQLAKDFCNAFCGPSRSMLCDVVFKVKDREGNYRQVHGVRAIMAIRSRTFLEMLYGFVPPGAGQSGFSQNQTNLRAIEMKALSGESSLGVGLSSSGSAAAGGSGKELEHNKSLLAKRGSVGADSGKRAGERERRQSMLPNLSKSTTQKPNYLTVPSTGSSGTTAGGSGTGGMIKNAFNRLVSGNWSGWSGNIKGYKGEPMHIKVDQNKTKVDLNSLAICKEIAKIDTDKLTQKEFEIKEFDYETFQQTIEYIHNGQCKLSYETIPGLICAAEHYDLPDLLHACFHHANTHMKLSAAPKMMNALYQNSCFYVTAMQILDSIYEYIDPHGNEFFTKIDYYELYESVFTTLLSRKTLQVSEVKKFQAMYDWTKHQILAKQQQKQQKKLSIQKRTSFEQQQQQQHQHQQRHDSQEQLMTGVVEDKDIAVEETNTGSIYTGSITATTTTNEANTNTTTAATASTTCPGMIMETEEMEHEFRNLMNRLNKEVNIKLDKISNEDLVKIVLPTKVFSNDKIFDVMADESRMEY